MPVLLISRLVETGDKTQDIGILSRILPKWADCCCDIEIIKRDKRIPFCEKTQNASVSQSYVAVRADERANAAEATRLFDDSG